jgi:NAD(P)-dependent dehydrogenase (short-subunit alcohol dehydrogenase family)
MVMAFARAGADVMIVSRKLEACEEAARTVERETGRSAFPYSCHVGHWSELDGLVDAAYTRFGKIDVLVNNAGMQPRYPSPVEITEELWDKVVAVNLKGPFRLTALVGTRMVEDRGGSIVNVSSTGSIRPAPHIIPYSAAKAGLNAITEACAQAFAPTVRVNCLMAGPFRTAISEHWGEGSANSRRGQALGRIGDPGEIVGAALYLASDASSYTTGSILRVDGGLP